jgi:metal-sulfur cluster biosynthetic enzyme
MAALTSEDLVLALREVNDPEYPISIVDMGLVRGVSVEGSRAHVKITYTSLGCPCKDLILEDVRTRLLAVDGIDDVEIEEVYEEWRRDHMSRRGVRALREMGVG